jgi:anaerobic magnesium-protoporphyrin IX monomethyl ester cyclase
VHTLFVHAAYAGVPFNSSIAALSAWLKAAGHTVQLLVVADEASDDAITAAAGTSQADVVALSFMTCRLGRVSEVLSALRRGLPAARFIAGGAHPTTYPEETLASMALDAVCSGEGEVSLLDWMAHPDDPHPGILRRGHSDAVTRPRVADVDGLPDWDRGLFGDVSNAGNRYEEAVGVAMSRGFCPFTCTFCGIDAFRRLHDQPTAGAMNLRSVERCMAEMERVSVDTSAGFAAWDAIFPLDRQWVRDFSVAYRDRIAKPLAVQLRVEQVTESLVGALAEAGCDYAVLGLECGDEAYRKRFLDKPFSNTAGLAAVARLEAAGICVHASFIMGLPFETPAMLAATVRMAAETGASELSWKYYTPERLTRLYTLAEANGLLIPRYVDHPFGADQAMIKLTHCSQSDLDKAQAALRIVRGPAPTERGPRPRPAVELRG